MNSDGIRARTFSKIWLERFEQDCPELVVFSFTLYSSQKQMSSSENEDSFASTASEATNISSLGGGSATTSVATAAVSIGSTIPADPNRPSNRPGSVVSKAKAVEQAADIGIVSYLLFKKDTLKFTTYCNQDCALFGDPDTKLRSSVLNRKGYLTKLQKTDPTGFEALAGKYGLITNHQQHLASPPAAAATLRRQASPPPAHAPSRSSNKKKKARRSHPSTITVSSPPVLVHETMANPPPAARPRVGGGTSSFYVIGHSLFLLII